ncbi:MAG: hypothetical protein GVY36_06235 [Verrucomicrobia bacterium]|jgi:hypothetical protein|nr:hypothetical protein [Verrucomicrobiota bacterium]
MPKKYLNKKLKELSDKKRMGHKNSTTTEDHYIDKDTSQELIDLYEKYAKELFGDIAFPK